MENLSGYDNTVCELHSFKDKNKRKLLREIFVYDFLFYICLFIGAYLL